VHYNTCVLISENLVVIGAFDSLRVSLEGQIKINKAGVWVLEQHNALCGGHGTTLELI